MSLLLELPLDVRRLLLNEYLCDEDALVARCACRALRMHLWTREVRSPAVVSCVAATESFSVKQCFFFCSTIALPLAAQARVARCGTSGAGTDKTAGDAYTI